MLSGLPLIVYPAVFFAGVMALTSPGGGGEPLFIVVVATLFLVLALFYPVVYTTCLVAFFVCKVCNRSMLIRIPFYYFLLCLVLLTSLVVLSPL